MRLGRDAWILGILLIVFVVASSYYSGLAYESHLNVRPTSYSTGKPGTKAFFELLSRQGYSVSRFEHPLQKLPSGDGLLIMLEPQTRDFAKGEADALSHWIEAGGTLLFVASPDYLGSGLGDPVLRKLSVDVKNDLPDKLKVISASSPYFADVRQIAVAGKLRLKPAPKAAVTMLLSDSEGGYAAVFKYGMGSVVCTTVGVGLDNSHVADEDNALFYLNIARVHAGKRKQVMFEEYHQGFGDEVAPERTLWMALGKHLQAACWYALVLLAFVLYNANVRFGAPKLISFRSARPSTEYLVSMAALFKRAAAPEIALEFIYKSFVRDLTRRLALSPDVDAELLARATVVYYGWEFAVVKTLLDRSVKIVSGDKATEHECWQLTQQIQEYRRRAELDRISK